MVGEKVIYVEPNNRLGEIYNMKDSQGNVYPTQVALEDLCISMNLMVEVRGRSMQSATNDGNRVLIMSWESQGGKQNVNFMAGSRLHVNGKGSDYVNALTTDYTDIYIDEIQQGAGTNEMFGISSIDVQYNNFMVPEVTIEFVDIRGVSLFAREETRFGSQLPGSSEDYNIANSFFKCFFKFPYPKFTLMLKGFYGKPVSYELTCADFRARFDSNTGNFNATAKFVGYSFSFLNDVTVTALFAAPYSDFLGAKYWEARSAVDNGFRLPGAKGGTVSMPKMLDIYKNLQNLVGEAESLAREDPNVKGQEDIHKMSSDLTEVMNAYNFFIEAMRDAYKPLKELEPHYCDFVKKENLRDGKQMTEEDIARAGNSDATLPMMWELMNADSSPNCFVIAIGAKMSSALNSGSYIMTKDVDEAYNKLAAAVKTFNETHGNSGVKLRELVTGKNGHYRRQAGMFNFNNLPDTVTFNRSSDLYRNHLSKERYVAITRRIEENLKEADRLTATYKISHPYDLRTPSDTSKVYTSIIFFDNGLLDSIRDVRSKVNADQAYHDKAVEEKYEEAATNLLTFHPSVQNVTKIIMAHFETLMYMIKETARNILSEDPQRNVQTLGLTGDNLADLQKEGVTGSDLVVPPFPRVVKRINEGGVDKDEDEWIGVFDGDFREKDLVYSILNGVSHIERITNAVTSNSTQSTNKSAYSMKCPTTPMDLCLTSNPYAGVDTADLSDVLGRVGLRMMYAMSRVNCFGSKFEKYSSLLGKAEAANFAASYPNPSADFLKKLNGNTLNGKYVLSILKSEQSAEAEKKNGKWAWDGIRSKNSAGLLKSVEGRDAVQLSAFMVDGYPILPMQGKSFKDAINEMNPDASGKCRKPSMMSGYFSVGDTQKPDNSLSFTFDTNLSKYEKVVTDCTIPDVDMTRIHNEISAHYEGGSYGAMYRSLTLSERFQKEMSPAEGNRLLPPVKRDSATIASGKLFSGDGAKDVFNGTGEFVRFYDKDGNKVERNYNGDVIKDVFAGEYPSSAQHTITTFKGIDELGNLTSKCSLFGQKSYYEACTEVRAIYFLRSIIDNVNRTLVRGALCSYKPGEGLMVVPYAEMLYECSMQWLYLQKRNGNEPHIVLARDFDLPMREDMVQEMASIFQKWATGEYATNIAPYLELNFKGDFGLDDLISSIAPKGYVVDTESINVERILTDNLSDRFFETYISVGSKVNGGLLLANREASDAISKVTELLVKPCVFGVNTGYANGKYSVPAISNGAAESFFNSFIERLRKEYEGVSQTEPQPVQQAEDPNTDDKICLGVYRYLKLLYDKWIAGSIDEMENKYTMQQFFYDDNPYFYFIDSFYNELPNKAVIGLKDFVDRIDAVKRQDGYTLLSLLSDLYSKNKFMFLCIQNFMDMSRPENMNDMFRPIPYLEAKPPTNHPNFIVMFPYEPSSKLDIPGEEYSNDSYMLTYDNRQNWPKPLQGPTGYQLPAFGVAYGRQYQSYFTSVDVSMEAPMATEQTIRTQFQIASMKGSSETEVGTGLRGTVSAGQDLYSIYSQNSYTCNVEMLGCAWVQPMMYFCLLNVPMFRGTYMIIKVTHRMEPGFMKTVFTGVRMSKYASKINDQAIFPKSGDAASSDGDSEVSYGEVIQDVNGCKYKTYPPEYSDIPVGGDYGQKDMTAFLNRTLKEFLPNASKLGNCPTSVTVANGLAGILRQEADASTEGRLAVASALYNRCAYMDSVKSVFNTVQLAAWKDAPSTFFTSPDSTCLEIIRKVFKQGSASAMAGMTFTMTEDPNLNGNNTRFGIKRNVPTKITPEMAVGLFYWGFVKEWRSPSKYHMFNRKYSKTVYLIGQIGSGAGSGSGAGQIFCAAKSVLDTALKSLNENRNSSSSARETESQAPNSMSADAKALYASVKKTVDTSDHLKFSMDAVAGSGNTVVFTGERLNDIFDIVLCGYYDRITSVTWYAGGQNDVSSEKPLRVIAEAGSSSQKTVRLMFSDNKGEHVPRIESKKDANANFLVSVKRKYGNDTKTMMTEVKNFHGVANVDFTDVPTGNCGDASDFQTNSDTNTGNHGTAPRSGADSSAMIGDWHFGLTKQWMIANINTKGASYHQCARTVKAAMAIGGVPYQSGCDGGTCYMKYKNLGFKEVWSGAGANNTGALPSNVPLMAGDLLEWTAPAGHTYGHIAIYLGNDCGNSGWYTDFIQATSAPSSKKGNSYSTCRLRLWRYVESGHCVSPTKGRQTAASALKTLKAKGVIPQSA